MPLVAHIDLPTFKRLHEEGEDILAPDRAAQQDIREMHIGLLNLMPDAALEATERQFFRLVGACNQIVQFHVHPFTVQGLNRSPEAQAHIDTYYESFEKIKLDGLDALIISGANVTQPHLPEEDFWEPLIEVFSWAKKNVTSILYPQNVGVFFLTNSLIKAILWLLKLTHALMFRTLVSMKYSKPIWNNVGLRFWPPAKKLAFILPLVQMVFVLYFFKATLNMTTLAY
jgi:hypothetical protein